MNFISTELYALARLTEVSSQVWVDYGLHHTINTKDGTITNGLFCPAGPKVSTPITQDQLDELVRWAANNASNYNQGSYVAFIKDARTFGRETFGETPSLVMSKAVVDYVTGRTYTSPKI